MCVCLGMCCALLVARRVEHESFCLGMCTPATGATTWPHTQAVRRPGLRWAAAGLMLGVSCRLGSVRIEGYMLDVCRWSMDSLRLRLVTQRQWGCTEHRQCRTCCSVQQLHKEPNSVKLVEVALFDCHGNNCNDLSQNRLYSCHITEIHFHSQSCLCAWFALPNDFSMSQWKHRCFSNKPCECSVLYESQKDSVSWTDDLYPSFSLHLSFFCLRHCVYRSRR